jgi:hypothetical protein
LDPNCVAPFRINQTHLAVDRLPQWQDCDEGVYSIVNSASRICAYIRLLCPQSSSTSVSTFSWMPVVYLSIPLVVLSMILYRTCKSLCL